MKSKIQKWGNSDGIRIPSNILKSLNLSTNDIVEISEDGNKIIIYKSVKKHYTLAERINEYNKLPNEEKGNVEPYDWGNDVGNEKWD